MLFHTIMGSIPTKLIPLLRSDEDEKAMGCGGCCNSVFYVAAVSSCLLEFRNKLPQIGSVLVQLEKVAAVFI